MRVHKARGAAYDLDRERQYNWWKSKPGRKLNGAVHQYTRKELAEFCAENGMELAGNCTVADARHK